MKVLVLGSGGMLGHKFTQVLNERWETWGTVTGAPGLAAHFTGVSVSRMVPKFDALDPRHLRQVLDDVQPDWVVNAIGLIKQSPLMADSSLARALNTELPQSLAEMCHARDSRLIHLSTDCVFSGTKGGYSDTDVPDADDVYGQTKAAGESLSNALVIRTSTIGRELARYHGLLEWFLHQPPGPIPGFSRAIWSGFPSVVLAGLVAEIMEAQPELAGLFNLSSAPIDKYQLLSWLGDAFGGKWEIQRVESPILDRSLDGSRLVEATEIDLPGWPQMIEALRRDSLRHDELRKSL